MKNYSSKRIALKSISAILATIGFVLGFAKEIVAQYGAPPARFFLKGKVLSEECNNPLPNIKINVESKNQLRYNNGKNYNGYTITTDENGNFTYSISEWSLSDTFVFTAKDVDDTVNFGKFHEKTIDFNPQNNPINFSHWDSEFKNTFIIKMKTDGIPPCKKEIPEKPKPQPKIKKIKAKQPQPTNTTPETLIPVKNTPEKDITNPDNGGKEPNNISQQPDNKPFDYKFYPSPTKDNFKFEIYATKSGTVETEIVDANGKLIKKLTNQITAGNNLLNFDLIGLPTGTYFVTLNWENQVISEKVIKIK